MRFSEDMRLATGLYLASHKQTLIYSAQHVAMKVQNAMMKAIAQLTKPAHTKTRKPYSVSVGLDAFGNAVPEAKSLPVEFRAGASRIVRREEMLVHPSRKRTRKNAKLTLMAFRRLLPALRKPPLESSPTPSRDEPLDVEFRLVPQVVKAPDLRLEPSIHETTDSSVSATAVQGKMPAQALPLALAVAGVVFYLLYVMTGMQGSMSTMSGNIQTMATDTRAMSQNMQAMNRNVEQMNQNVGAIAKSTAPMGEAASTVSPFTRMVKAILPF